MTNDEKWMKIAFNEALKAKLNGEVPVGSVLVKNNQIIAKAHNRPISKNDATAHAEIEVIRASGKILDNYRLVNTTIYITLQPCYMCIAAIAHARISKIVFGAYDTKKAYGESLLENFVNSNPLNHKIETIGGVYELECTKLLKDFFIERR